MDLENLKKSIGDYNRAASGEAEDAFGKSKFPVQFGLDEKLFVASVIPAVHYTMGGLAISSNAQVFAEHGELIGGLFGAGEVTGGVHGSNRLGGNSLLECVVYGRIAGQNAAGVKSHGH